MRQSAYILLAVFALLALSSCHREDPSLELGSSQLVLKSEGGSQTVSFTCNYKWMAKASDPWMTVSPASGDKGSNTLTIQVAPNTDVAKRRGSVSITCESITRSIQIEQAQSFNQTLMFVFSGTELTVPRITGNDLSAEIDWGDGVKENYSVGIKHTYGAAGNHTVTIKLAGGNSFEIGTAAGVSEVDLSEF